MYCALVLHLCLIFVCVCLSTIKNLKSKLEELAVFSNQVIPNFYVHIHISYQEFKHYFPEEKETNKHILASCDISTL